MTTETTYHEPGWLSIAKLGGETPEERLELTLNVGSFKDPIVVSIDARDWSRMLSNPGQPVAAMARFEARL